MNPKHITRIIGIAGKAGSGKSTFAEMLTERIGYNRYSLASSIKNMLRVGLGLDEGDKYSKKAEEMYGVSYRKLAQSLGTEWGRKTVRESIWLDIAKRATIGMCSVIDDIRFEDEAKYVREHGYMIHIDRKSQDIIVESGHDSERGIVRLEEDILVPNNSDLKSLESWSITASAMLKYMFEHE